MERSPTAAQTNSIAGAQAEAVPGEVDRLIAAGKCKQAVERAKEDHKRLKTLESEAGLVQAYLARIEQFQNKGMGGDADLLLALVRQRFPEQRHRLKQLEVRSMAAGGRLRELVAPLANGETPPEVCACIEATVRQHVIDLPGLAGCDALPADHPLRIAAGAISRAFEAVTTGPVSDEQTALPEVTRRSPLAGWKMLVRAIAAFHRHDDPGCRRALDAIPADAAVARLARVVRAMIDQTPIREGLAGALQARIVSDDRPLRSALEGIENAFRWTDLTRLQRAIREAVRACSTSHPELYERLRQHISVACVLKDVPVDEVVRAMGSSRKDAYFWRLLARVSELEGARPVAAVYWERFLRHAVAERMFAEKSLEAAMVYLHAAGMLSAASLRQLSEWRRRLSELDTLTAYYRGQPPDIAALAPRSDKQIVDTVLSPGWLFERAAEIHPAPETFRQWWSWAQEVELPDRFREDVARRWHEKQPGDPQPLLNLSMLAERRNALKMALNHLSAAEAIDSLNPQVRQTRVRLTLATTWRHFKDNKPHLIENDLAELAALPGMAVGDRAAFVGALRAAWQALRHDEVAARSEIDVVIEKAGALAGGVILESVALLARLPRDHRWPSSFGPALPDPHEVVRAEIRMIRLAIDLELRMVWPAAWEPITNDVLRERDCPLTQAELLAIGRAAVGRANFEQAYLAASAGLATSGSNPGAVARFLLLRAQSLAAPWARERAAQCLLAALDLARQTHDAQLLQEVVAQVDRHPGAKRAIASAENGRGLDDDVLAEILKHERDAPRFPRDRADAERYLAIMAAEGFDSGYPDAFPLGDNDNDDDDDHDNQEIDDSLPLNPPRSLEDFGPEVLEVLAPLLSGKGRLPTPAELMKTDPELLLRLMAALGSGRLDEVSLNDVLDEPAGEPGSGFFGGFFSRRSRKPKKKRR